MVYKKRIRKYKKKYPRRRFFKKRLSYKKRRFTKNKKYVNKIKNVLRNMSETKSL